MMKVFCVPDLVDEKVLTGLGHDRLLLHQVKRRRESTGSGLKCQTPTSRKCLMVTEEEEGADLHLTALHRCTSD